MKPDTRAFLEQLANGEFLSPFKRDPLEHAKSHIETISERARELLREEDDA